MDVPAMASGPAMEPSGVTGEGEPGDPVIYRYRFYYQKRGGAVYLSHLDVKRALKRAIRAAGLEADYSRGFSPHPRLSFAPPLPLGYHGRNEFFEGRFLKQLRPDLDISLVNRNLPRGLRISSIVPFTTAKGSLLGAFQLAQYIIRFDLVEGEGRFGAVRAADELSRALATFQERETWLVEHRGKSGKQTFIDLKQSVLELGRSKNGPPTTFFLSIRTGQGNGPEAKVKMILSEIFGLAEEEMTSVRVTRKGFG